MSFFLGGGGGAQVIGNQGICYFVMIDQATWLHISSPEPGMPLFPFYVCLNPTCLKGPAFSRESLIPRMHLSWYHIKYPLVPFSDCCRGDNPDSAFFGARHWLWFLSFPLECQGVLLTSKC